MYPTFLIQIVNWVVNKASKSRKRNQAGSVNKADGKQGLVVQRWEVSRRVNRRDRLPPHHEDMILGHLIFNPSSHRRYKSSAIGDFLEGASWEGEGETRWLTESDDGGSPDMTSCSSVMTNPLEVISLFRMTRLWGNRPLDV